MSNKTKKPDFSKAKEGDESDVWHWRNGDKERLLFGTTKNKYVFASQDLYLWRRYWGRYTRVLRI